jgi:hypothetical protein
MLLHALRFGDVSGCHSATCLCFTATLNINAVAFYRSYLLVDVNCTTKVAQMLSCPFVAETKCDGEVVVPTADIRYGQDM